MTLSTTMMRSSVKLTKKKQGTSYKRIVQKLESLFDDDEDTTVNIPISLDGTWSKRGHTANHCIGFVISAATGKVLNFKVISKVCHQCSQMAEKLHDTSFNEWYQDHICEGSYKGSSPSMEMECAKQLWGRGENNFVRYKWMICDGDSKSYNAIWNVYGACDTCHKYEAMEQTDKELFAWKNSRIQDVGRKPSSGKGRV